MRTRLPALLFVFVLIVAACGSSEGEVTTTIEDSGATDSTSSATTSTAADDTTTIVAAETTTTAGGGSVDKSCVVGSWEMDSEGFVAQLQELFAEEMQGASVEFASGSYIVTFGADGSFTGVRDDWVWRIETTEGTLVQTINSEETGTYTFQNGELKADVDPITFDVKSQIEVDGQLLDLPSQPGGVTLDDDQFDPHGQVDCDSDQLIVSTDEELQLVFNKT